MICWKCEKKLNDGSLVCDGCGSMQGIFSPRGRKKVKNLILLLCTTWVILGTLIWVINDHRNKALNPILNSANDITDELINRMISNSLESLTINYQFTRCKAEDETTEDYEKIRLRDNPFWIANKKVNTENISYEIKLSPDVTSLDCAFSNMEKLKSINLKDTSSVTSKKSMY